MVRCPKCKGINTKSIEGIFSCNFCFNGWSPDVNAERLYLEWVELDKSDRLVAQVLTPGGKYNVQCLDGKNVLRRSEVATELKNKHQHSLDLPPDVWYRIFQDSH